MATMSSIEQFKRQRIQTVLKLDEPPTDAQVIAWLEGLRGAREPFENRLLAELKKKARKAKRGRK